MFQGTPFWRCIHFFALHNVGRDILRQVVKFLPETYANEWEAPTDDEDLIDWSLRFHNRVNAKKGDWAHWDRTDFGISHKPECDFCEDKEFVFFFPWGFLHAVAESQHPDSLAFLQKWDTVYPMKACHGPFFTDGPAEGETVKDWVIRHHKRLNVAKNREEMMYVPVENVGVVGSVAVSGKGCTDCT